MLTCVCWFFIVKQNTRSPTSSSGAFPGVKLDATGTPVQTFNQGSCKRPGCPYGKRMDTTTGNVLNYCSRTCASKDTIGQPSGAGSAIAPNITSSGLPPVLASLDPGVLN